MTVCTKHIIYCLYFHFKPVTHVMGLFFNNGCDISYLFMECMRLAVLTFLSLGIDIHYKEFYI